jgi:hypothetical protein
MDAPRRETYFTASEIGKSIGQSRFAVRRMLADAAGNPIPLSPFPRELRLMLSLPRRSTVGGNGIRTKIPGQGYIWFDSVELSKRRNEAVLVRIDPGNLDEILVTDMKGENSLLVPRLATVPADGATREQMRAAMASVKERSEYGKTYYRSLRPESHPGFSHVILDVEARNALVEVEAQRGAQTQQRSVATARRASTTASSNRNIEIIQDFLK